MTTPSTPSEGGPATPRVGSSSMQQKQAKHVQMAAPTATPVGGRAFTSPAMLRILLTPATSDVTPEEFERMTNAIRRIESIRLSDLPRSAQRGETVPPTSALAKAGEVHITFVTSYDPSHAFLSPFNVHRQVLGVLGLAMCSSAKSVDALERAPAALRRLHPHAVVHRVFGFDVGATRPQSSTGGVEEGNETIDSVDYGNGESSVDVINVEGGDMGEGSLTRSPPDADAQSKRKLEERPTSASSSSKAGFSGRQDTGLVIFPAVRRDLKDVRFYLKTLVPNFIGDVLDGLDTFVKELQGKPLETPRETLDGTMSSAMSASSTKTLGANVGAAASSAASRASALFSSFSSTDETTSRKVSKTSKSTQSVVSTGPMGSGRYAKIKADYYLLVGDLWNALHTYDQCMSLLGKERALAGGQDAVWYASALEGWAVARTLTARMGGQVEEKAPSVTLPLGNVKEKDKDKVTIEFQFAGKAWSDIAEAYSLALAMYSKCLAPASYLLESMRSVNPETPRDYTHPLIHASACLAYSRLLLAIWASGGWNGETFDQLLLGGVPPALAETSRPTMAVYMQHTTASGIHRHDVAAPASQSLTNSSTNALKMLDQIHLYASLSALFGCLGFARKEAYVIQRLQSLVVVLIAQGINLQKNLGSSNSQALRPGDAAHGTILTQISSNGGGHGSDSILVLALQICQTYGINVQLMPLLNMDRTHILARASVDAKSGKRLSAPLLSRNRSSWSTDASSPTNLNWQQYLQDESNARVTAISDLLDEAPFGWTEQQIVILKDTITICEMLQDKTAMVFFASIMLRDFWTHLGFEEQFKLKDGIAKTMAEVERGTGKGTTLQYWGPKDILAGIELEASRVSCSTTKKVHFHELTQERDIDVLTKRKKRHGTITSGTQEDVLMQDELTSFAVSLYNPLLIPLELESIRLELTTVGSLGPSFESVERKSVILPPSSVHVVRLSGTPRGEGRLCVRGVQIKLPFCAERMFTFAHAHGTSAEKTMWKAQTDMDDRWTRTKRFGLDARGQGSTGQGLQASFASSAPPRARSRMQESLWLLPVIAKVPEVEIRGSTALRSGTVILCDGEESTVSLTMTNVSPLAIDFVRFSFDDDFQRGIVDLLSDGHLEANDVFELENDLLSHPFLSLEGGRQDDVLIETGRSKKFTFRVRAKLDVRTASIDVQYGNKAESRQLGREHFWVRQASFSFDVRVLPTVFIDGLEIVPIDRADLLRAHVHSTDVEHAKHGVMLVSLAAHNAHPSEVEVKLDIEGALSVEEDGGKGRFVQRRLPAHSSVRLHVLLPRKAPKMLEETLYKPIPKLVERQFIVSRVQRSSEEERKMRAKFWLRRTFLESVRSLTWTDVKTKRTGAIGTEGVHFESDDALSVVYGDRMTVRISLKSDGGKSIEATSTGKDAIEVRPDEFVELEAEVQNVSDAPVRARYALSPGNDVSDQRQEKVLCVSGHMQGQLWPDVQGELTSHASIDQLVVHPGQSSRVTIVVCFSTGGTFPLTFTVSEQQFDQGKATPMTKMKKKGTTSSAEILVRKGILVHVH